MDRRGPQLALLLLGCYRTLVDAAVAELAERGHPDVRPSYHYAMAAIDGGATSASELGRRLSVTKQAALRTIGILTERGWVAREQDPDDARQMRLHLTERGREVIAVGEEIFDDLRHAWERELGAEDLALLEQQLTRMVGDSAVRPDSPGWVAHEGA